MATGTDAGGTWNTTAGNKTVTATPASNDLIVVVHGMSGWASGDDSVITDNNSDGLGTYTRIGTAAVPLSTGGGTAGALWFSVRNALIGSASSTVFTATVSGDTGGGLTVLRFSGMTRTGPLAIRQSKGDDNNTESPPTITLPGDTITGNPIVLAIMGEDNPVGVTVPGSAGFTLADDTGWSVPTTGIQVAWTNDYGAVSLFLWTGGALTDHNEFVVELNASAVSVKDLIGMGILPRAR